MSRPTREQVEVVVPDSVVAADIAETVVADMEAEGVQNEGWVQT